MFTKDEVLSRVWLGRNKGQEITEVELRQNQAVLKDSSLHLGQERNRLLFFNRKST